MKVKAIHAALILPLMFLLGIGGTMISGYWQTESTKIPVKFSEGEAAGEFNPADIRGSYSLQDIEDVFEVSVETLAQAFGMSSRNNPGDIQVKEFEESYGDIDGLEVGTDSMRYFVALYLDRPFVLDPGTALPQPAYNILKKEGVLSAERLEEAAGQAVSLEGAHILTAEEDSHDGESSGLLEIKGKTTFHELYESGITAEQISDALGGLEPGPRGMSVRDYCMENNIEFSGVKGQIQTLLDAGL